MSLSTLCLFPLTVTESPACEGPSPTINNSISTSNTTTVRLYTCIEGFVQTGTNPKSVCDTATGVWSTPDVECKDINCGEPPDVTDAKVMTAVEN